MMQILLIAGNPTSVLNYSFFIYFDFDFNYFYYICKILQLDKNDLDVKIKKI